MAFTKPTIASIFGSSSVADSLIGTSEDDIISGGGQAITYVANPADGIDIFEGLDGNDSYIVNDIGDTVIEAVAGGIDTVFASVSYTLPAEVENIVASGTTQVTLIGNSLANILDGTGSVSGSTDTLQGMDGNDTYILGVGDKVIEGALSSSTATQYTNNSLTGGIDTIIATAGAVSIATVIGASGQAKNGADVIKGQAFIENIILTNTAGAVAITGNTLANRLTGNNFANTLTGNAGDDVLDGGLNNKGAAVGATTAIVTAVVSAISGTFANAAAVATAAANAGASAAIVAAAGSAGSVTNAKSVINTAANVAVGFDTLIGGLGNDTYIVRNAGDLVQESSSSNEGTDTVKTSVTLDLSDVAFIENITLLGSEPNVTATGNDLNNVLIGNGAANTLSGGLGNDTLNGGGGADTLIGGTGNDIYFVDNSNDVIKEGISTDTVNAGSGIDLVNSSVDYTLSAAVLDSGVLVGVENLTLTGTGAIDGTGNALINVLTGNDGKNTLSGGDNNDTLVGGLGNDTLNGGNSDDRLFGGDGVDTLVGGAGNDILDGGLGADGGSTGELKGGAGNDTYVVDNAGDKVTETSALVTEIDSVNSSVTYTLPSNVENLTLTGLGVYDSVAKVYKINGTGNDGNNIIMGNVSVNTLTGGDGNDTLNGGFGADTLVGGAGDDIYYVDDADTDTDTDGAGTDDTDTDNGDTITDSSGNDTVYSSITFTLTSTLENLTLTGSSAINATGTAGDNVLTGNNGVNTLTGGDGKDTLDGGLGNDKLDGGAGDDTYVVNTGDTLIDSGGTDTIVSSLSYVLPATGFENLTLTGTSTINATGNTGNNVLTGNGANNSLNGGDGNDTLIGGAGKDTVTTGSGDDIVRFASGVTDTVAAAASVAGIDVYTDLAINAATLDRIDLTVHVDKVGTAVSGAITGANFISKMDEALNTNSTSSGFGKNGNDIYAAVVTVNSSGGDATVSVGDKFLAVDLNADHSFDATDFVIEITGSTVTSLTTATFI